MSNGDDTILNKRSLDQSFPLVEALEQAHPPLVTVIEDLASLSCLGLMGSRKGQCQIFACTDKMMKEIVDR